MHLGINKTLFFLLVLFSQFKEANNFPTSSITSSTGLVLNPSARFQSEGTVNLNISYFKPFNKFSLVAAPYDWLEASVYYNDINVREYFPGSEQSYKDKGFSFKVRLKEETNFFPQIAIGFEDIAGTSLFKSEYLVMSKSTKNFDFTLGYASGFLGSEGNTSNIFRDGSRDPWDFSTGGQTNFSDVFKGSSSFFGGIEYVLPYTNNWSAKIEYDASSYKDNYDLLPNLRKYEKKSNINYSLLIPIKNAHVSVAYLNDSSISASVNLRYDISKKNQKYNEISRKNHSDISIEKKILNDLKANNIFVQAINIDGINKSISVFYAQNFYSDDLSLSKRLKKYIYSFDEYANYKLSLIPMNGAVKKSQLNYLPHSNAYTISDSSKMVLEDSTFVPNLNLPIIFNNFNLDLSSHIGSPAGFFFGGLELNFNTEILFERNIQLYSQISKTIFSNYDDLSYDPGFTDLEPVRTNIQNYLKNDSIHINQLNLKIINNFDNHSFLTTFGLIEEMFGGVHTQYLYKPFNSLFSFGFDAGFVKQRTTEQLLDFNEYQTFTGHLNFYFYEPKYKIKGKLSYGRYLAKDDGFTLDFSRRFKNGSEIGAFFSRTNISKIQFGEGSFDKGVYIKYPIPTLFGNKNSSSDNNFNKFIYRPLTRDGAAKLWITHDLHDILMGSSKHDYMLGW